MAWAEVKLENGVTYIRSIYRDDGPKPTPEEGFEIIDAADIPKDAVRLELTEEKPTALKRQLDELTARVASIETSVSTVSASVDAFATDVEEIKTRVTKVEGDIKAEPVEETAETADEAQVNP